MIEFHVLTCMRSQMEKALWQRKMSPERAAGHERRGALVLLLSASVLRVRDEPPGSSLFSPEGAGTDGEEDGAGRSGGRRGRVQKRPAGHERQC